MAVEHLATFIDVLGRVGVSKKTLAPLLQTRDKFANIDALLATTYKSDPLGDLLESATPGGDLAAGAKQAAEHRAIAETLELYTTHADFYERQAVKQWKTEDVMNAVLSQIGKKWDTANAYLAKIEKRWGSTEPSPAQLLAVATEEDLAQWRGRAPHLATIAAIKDLFKHWLVTGQSSIPDVYRFIDLEGVRTMRTNPQMKFAAPIDWFLDADGRIGTVQDSYKRVNDVLANDERSRFIEACRSVSPAPRFVGKYCLTRDAANVRFNADGTPEDPSVIATHDEVMRLWNPSLFAAEVNRDAL